MLKYTYETEEQELKTWVDPENGSLNVQIGNETVIIPQEVGAEMVAVIRQKQSIFHEIERKKTSSWNRFLESISGQEKSSFSEIKGKRYEAA
ncbi:MAG: hypothetical protein WD398_13175 [Cyclobacteriaceae bacterium]